MTEPIRDIAGGLAVRILGEGPTLALLHGGTGSWTHWVRNVDTLAQRFRVVAFDLPGYGDSPDIGRRIPVEDYVGVVRRAILGLATPGEKLRLAAFSFGGVVAAAVAARSPAALAKLALVAPGGFGRASPRVVELRRIPPGPTTDPVVRSAYAFNLGRMMMREAPPIDHEAVDLQIANVARTRFDSRRISLGDTLPADLAKVDCPVQLVWGTSDGLAFPSVEARLALCREVRPDLRVDLVPGAGHWVQFEEPETVNRLLLDFLA